MALEGQLVRLREQANQFNDLRDRVKKAAASWPFLHELVHCVDAIANGYAESIETRLSLMRDGSRLSATITAKPLDNLEKSTAELLATLSSLIQGPSSWPGEFIEFVSSCFAKVGRSNPPFAIAPDGVIAMMTLREIAESGQFETVFPEFFRVFENESVGQFVILFLPEHLLSRSRSLTWPVVAHEVGHAFVEQSGIVAKRYPDMPTSWPTLTRLADQRAEPVRTQARRVMQLSEFACDEVAVRLTGCVFPWRLLKDVFSVHQIASSKTHPRIDKRVRRAAELARDLGFVEQCETILNQLKQELSDVELVGAEDDIPEAEFEEVSQAVKRAIPQPVDIGRVEAECGLLDPPLTRVKAAEVLRSGRPLALPDWVVFSLATPDDDIQSSGNLQETIADAIRLGQVKREFKQVMTLRP